LIGLLDLEKFKQMSCYGNTKEIILFGKKIILLQYEQIELNIITYFKINNK